MAELTEAEVVAELTEAEVAEFHRRVAEFHRRVAEYRSSTKAEPDVQTKRDIIASIRAARQPPKGTHIHISVLNLFAVLCPVFISCCMFPVFFATCLLKQLFCCVSAFVFDADVATGLWIVGVCISIILAGANGVWPCISQKDVMEPAPIAFAVPTFVILFVSNISTKCGERTHKFAINWWWIVYFGAAALGTGFGWYKLPPPFIPALACATGFAANGFHSIAVKHGSFTYGIMKRD